jgi:hypothetical protein
MKLLQKLKRFQFLRSVEGLLRLACVLALVGLAVMVFSIVVPRPLAVIGAMSVGHGIGAAALLCYLVAIVIDARRGRAKESDESS